MGNWVAYVSLLVWPLISIWFYQKKTVQIATLWTLIGGFMFLPVSTSIDLPMIPPLGKNSVPVLSALIGSRFVAKRRISFFTSGGWINKLFILFVIGPFVTSELNGDSINAGNLHIPGMTFYDALSAVISQFIVIMPFFIGRELFKTADDQAVMFKTLVWAGLIYSVLILFEVRMSPQLHTWVYGYFPHSFVQQVRYGGFRPVVFMGHGLLVAFFCSITVIAAAVIWKLKDRVCKYSSKKITLYLLLVLVICKSVASILYGFLGFLLIMFSSVKNQLRVAAILVTIALLYPTMSIMNIFPHQNFLESVASIDTERAESLGFRFKNEHILLDHGRDRFFFGWGTWGRNRVYNAETGEDESVTDGHWIITFGQFGWLGFIAEFGLLSLPVFLSMKSARIAKNYNESIMFAGHAILVSLVIIDQLPNSSLSPSLWLLPGILLGRCEFIKQSIEKKYPVFLKGKANGIMMINKKA